MKARTKTALLYVFAALEEKELNMGKRWKGFAVVWSNRRHRYLEAFGTLRDAVAFQREVGDFSQLVKVDAKLSLVRKRRPSKKGAR